MKGLFAAKGQSTPGIPLRIGSGGDLFSELFQSIANAVVLAPVTKPAPEQNAVVAVPEQNGEQEATAVEQEDEADDERLSEPKVDAALVQAVQVQTPRDPRPVKSEQAGVRQAAQSDVKSQSLGPDEEQALQTDPGSERLIAPTAPVTPQAEDAEAVQSFVAPVDEAQATLGEEVQIARDLRSSPGRSSASDKSAEATNDGPQAPATEQLGQLDAVTAQVDSEEQIDEPESEEQLQASAEDPLTQSVLSENLGDRGARERGDDSGRSRETNESRGSVGQEAQRATEASATAAALQNQLNTAPAAVSTPPAVVAAAAVTVAGGTSGSSPAATASGAATSGANAIGGKSSAGPAAAILDGGGSRNAAVQQAVDADEPESSRQAQLADRARLVHRIAKAFQRLGLEGGLVRLKMHPEDLGSVELNLQVSGRKVQATVTAENAEAARLLTENLPELRLRLETQGLVLERLDVQARSDNGDGNSSRFQHPQGGSFGQSSHHREHAGRDPAGRGTLRPAVSTGGLEAAPGRAATASDRALDVKA